MSIRFEVPMLPPSENKMYSWDPMKKRPYKTKECSNFKSNFQMFCPPIQFKEGERIVVAVEYYGDWYYKNGKVRKKDGQNLQKAVYDALFEKIGIDDCHLWMWCGKKIQSDHDKMVITIEVLDGNAGTGVQG